ncbi:MAG: SagB/ThcOx family dehydrogenase [Fervidobacterium sp.]|uniref:SagB/ThcOx family dehydrogenase n=1 Tax=Fervidobacterium sp. TaxID=1871331 RepID=UPI0021FF42A1|nr:dehydrogenase [Fervidobacterium riparium]
MRSNDFTDFTKSRTLLKSNWEALENFKSDQQKGEPMPPFEKPISEGVHLVKLPEFKDSIVVKSPNVFEAIANRRSHRKYLKMPLTLEELSFLLWATQGVKNVTPKATFRTVPSAGARHPFETYVYVRNVEGLNEAVYRYLPIEHSLVLHRSDRYLREEIIRATLEQTFVGEAAAVFIWTAMPYRTEWRYGPASHKVILLDAGHVCQNLYIACEAIKAGTCAIAAYSQELMDKFLRLDGTDEFVVYLAPVGKVQ